MWIMTLINLITKSLFNLNTILNFKTYIDEWNPPEVMEVVACGNVYQLTCWEECNVEVPMSKLHIWHTHRKLRIPLGEVYLNIQYLLSKPTLHPIFLKKISRPSVPSKVGIDRWPKLTEPLSRWKRTGWSETHTYIEILSTVIIIDKHT